MQKPPCIFINAAVRQNLRLQAHAAPWHCFCDCICIYITTFAFVLVFKFVCKFINADVRQNLRLQAHAPLQVLPRKQSFLIAAQSHHTFHNLGLLHLGLFLWGDLILL